MLVEANSFWTLLLLTLPLCLATQALPLTLSRRGLVPTTAVEMERKLLEEAHNAFESIYRPLPSF